MAANPKPFKIFIKGFSLIELVLVLAVISIIALLALPSNVNVVTAKRVGESLRLLDNFKPLVAQYYSTTGAFPESNETLLMPEPDKLIGNYVSRIEMQNGVFHITLGNKIQPNLAGNIVSVLPVYVDGSPASPISWVCGFDAVPEGMTHAGENRTDLETSMLPLICR